MSTSKEDLAYVRQVAVHVWRKTSYVADLEDLIQSGWVGFLQAKSRWGGGGKLYAYAFARTKGAMLDWIRSEDYAQRHSRKHSESFEVVHGHEFEAACLPDYAEMMDLVSISDRLKGRHLEIWDRHCMGESGREIARDLGFTPSRISHILKEIKSLLTAN